MVRPIMEYGGSVWIPLYQKDRDRLEKVQQRSTRLVSEIRDMSYEERLRTLELPTLVFRKKRADVLQTFKIVNRLENIDEAKLFQKFEYKQTRGHKHKLSKPRSRLNIRKNSYAVRVINDWNALPSWVVDSTTVNQFKSGISKYWSDHQFKFCPYVTEEFARMTMEGQMS